MTLDESSTETWIDRLAAALPRLAELQEPYLQEYQRQNPREHHVFVNQEEIPPTFPLGDLCVLYAKAYHGNAFGKTEYFAYLREVLDPVRHILRSHPTLKQVVSPDHRQRRFLDAGSKFRTVNIDNRFGRRPNGTCSGVVGRSVSYGGRRTKHAPRTGECKGYESGAG